MSPVLIIATGGAGGDLQPLLAVAQALHERGHNVRFIGDKSVDRAVAHLGIGVELLPDELDLGPRLVAAVRDAMVATGGDLAAAGPLLQECMGSWAREVSEPVASLIERADPSAVVTSLFGVEVVADAAPACPWAVVNSTFYIGPNPPRPVEQDIGPRALPLVTRYAALLGLAPLVLHATDRAFDFDFAGLPPRHHYVGPLGIWEPPSEPPAYLDEPGDPWILVTISSQLGDDLPLAEMALEALAHMPVRVVLTIGPGHDPHELGSMPPNTHIEQSIPHSSLYSGSLDRKRQKSLMA
jgi:nucleoside-diphosphate-sugar epimerase